MNSSDGALATDYAARERVRPAREIVARIIDPKQWAIQDYGEVDGAFRPGWEPFLNPSLAKADAILAALQKSRSASAVTSEGLEQMKAGYTPKHVRRFIARFERDNARDMTPEQWGEWVNALPIPEFMAMCCMTPDQAASALSDGPLEGQDETPAKPLGSPQ